MQLPYFTYILSQVFWAIFFLALNIILNYFVLYPLSERHQSTDKNTLIKLLFDIDILAKDISSESKEIDCLESKYLEQLESKSKEYLNEKIAEFNEIEKNIDQEYMQKNKKMHADIKKWEKKFNKHFDKIELGVDDV